LRAAAALVSGARLAAGRAFPAVVAVEFVAVVAELAQLDLAGGRQPRWRWSPSSNHSMLATGVLSSPRRPGGGRRARRPSKGVVPGYRRSWWTVHWSRRGAPISWRPAP